MKGRREDPRQRKRYGDRNRGHTKAYKGIQRHIKPGIQMAPPAGKGKDVSPRASRRNTEEKAEH